MLKVGLTGGLATGKSFVGEVLVGLGCHLLQADQAGHEVLRRVGGEAYAGVVAEFGREILDAATEEIDRRRLGQIVFGDPDRLKKLNALVHPHVFARQEAFFDAVRERDQRGIAIVEAAIMIEVGSYVRYDRIILTVCDPAEQLRRAMERGGLTEAEAKARLARQMAPEEKRKFAHFVIDTSGEKESTVAQTQAVYEELRRIAV